MAATSVYHTRTFEVVMWTSESNWTVRVIFYVKVVEGDRNKMHTFFQYTKYTSVSCILRNVELVRQLSSSWFIANYPVHTRRIIPWQIRQMERHIDCRITELAYALTRQRRSDKNTETFEKESTLLKLQSYCAP